jgi:thioredoxin 1
MWWLVTLLITFVAGFDDEEGFDEPPLKTPQPPPPLSGGSLDTITDFVRRNPLLILAILYFIYKKRQSSQPWPDFGGCITKVHNLQEWDELLEKDKDKVVIVDAYALWCPPCKTAAPVFAKLSGQFSEASCTFAKIDVDDAKDVARQLGISAMPTFKFFKNKQEVETHQGWPGEAKIKEILLSHGAVLEEAKGKVE